MRILFVDDDPRYIRELIDEVTLDGHTVVQARTLLELQDALKSGPFDGVVLDLMFPPADGIPPEECAAGYSAGVYLYENFVRSALGGVPFVVLTAVDIVTTVFKEAIKKLEQYTNYRGWVQKPPEAEELERRLQTRSTSG